MDAQERKIKRAEVKDKADKKPKKSQQATTEKGKKPPVHTNLKSLKETDEREEKVADDKK